MSRTAVVMSLVAAVAIFSCGYITAKQQNAGAEVAGYSAGGCEGRESRKSPGR